jgi:hypothetical protein
MRTSPATRDKPHASRASARVSRLAQVALFRLRPLRSTSCATCLRTAGRPGSSSANRTFVPALSGALDRSVARAGRGRALAGVRARMCRPTSLPRYSASLVGMWCACSACLVAIFACQELLEDFFATGHPAGLAGIFGYGSWWSIPAALCVGLVLAAWLHGARWVLREVTRRRTRVRAAWRGPALLVPRPRDVVVALLAPLVGGWSGRVRRRELTARSSPRRRAVPILLALKSAPGVRTADGVAARRSWADHGSRRSGWRQVPLRAARVPLPQELRE